MLVKAIVYAVFRHVRCGLLLAATVVGASSALAAEEEWDYLVQPGDTLIGIAAQHFVDPQAWPVVQSRNQVADPRRIPIGTHLKIPLRLLRTDAVSVEVLMVNGQASRVVAGGRAGKPLAAGDSLRAGDKVRVDAGSNLSLRLPDGSRLLVLEKSRFSLRRAVRLGDTEMRRIQIDLSEGSIESSVTPAPGGVNQFEIRTPALRMGVRGTHFRAASESPGGRSRGEVLAGRVEFRTARRVITLGAGFGSYAAPGRPPQPPQRLAPAPEFGELPALYERVPLRFAWNPLPDARGYRAQILDSSANLVVDGVYHDNSTPPTDLPDGRYTLRVRSIDANRLEGLDAEHAFTLKARPEPPFVRRPTAKAYGEPTQFEWTEAARIGSYHFQLASDGAFAQLLADETALADSQITRTLAPGQYFWRIASVDAHGHHGPFSDVVAFEQRPLPASPQAEAPEEADGQFIFRWRAGEPGTRYLLQVAKTPEFSELYFEQTTEQAFASMPRPDPGDYFMRVKAIEADGFAGPFGATQKFTVPGTFPWWLLLLLIPVAL
jgi:hypothetical protein